MKKLLLALGLAGFTTMAMAQTVDFAAVDTDGSGTLSVEEIKAAMPDIDDARLAAADADGDGSLNQEEFDALTAG